MREKKKTIKVVLLINAVSMLLGGVMASPVCAAEKILSEAVASPGCAVKNPSGSAETKPEHEKETKETDNSKLADEDSEKVFGEEEPPGSDSTEERPEELDDVTKAQAGETANREGSGKEASSNTEQQAGKEPKNAPVSLQVPFGLSVVLNPWEMDGEKQIYSEEYIIKNTGEERGILKMTSIATGTAKDVNVRSDREGIHLGKDRNIFVEMVINGEDRITLLPEGTDYEAVLETDASITLTFTGEMNEDAKEGWHESDVKISVIYDWKIESEEGVTEEDEASEEDSAKRKNMPEREKSVETDAAEITEKESDGKESERTENSETVAEEGKTSSTETPKGGDGEEQKNSDINVSKEDAGDKKEPSGIEILESGGEEEVDTVGIDMPKDSGGEEEKTSGINTPNKVKVEEEKQPETNKPEENGGEETEQLDINTPKAYGKEETNPLNTDMWEGSRIKENGNSDTDAVNKENMVKESHEGEMNIEEKGGNK